MLDKKTKLVDWKNPAIITAIAVVAGGVAFGITWLIMDKSINEHDEVSDKLRIELQSQITSLLLKLNTK